MHKSYDWDVPNCLDADHFVYDRWRDFEESLGRLDEDDYINISQENISEYHEKIGMSEQLVDQFVSETSRILGVFRGWVLSIDIINSSRKEFSFNDDIYFINFNYTETLEFFIV
ncbi:Uncharacterised protein [Brucella abortus]|nr:bacteriophage abortive infection AbiH family protein [Brucella abortus 2308]SUW21629.1 Uncharacterised protein [Brucella abortus]